MDRFICPSCNQPTTYAFNRNHASGKRMECKGCKQSYIIRTDEASGEEYLDRYIITGIPKGSEEYEERVETARLIERQVNFVVDTERAKPWVMTALQNALRKAGISKEDMER